MKLQPVVLLGKNRRGTIMAWAIVSTIRQAKRIVAEFYTDNLTVTIAAIPHTKEALS